MKFSIITPSFNRVGMLDVCIKSVLSQNYPNFEHIVVDGGSTDGTLDLLKKYSHIRVISGPDRGMYDALNKGLAIASGDIVGFLNTDDLYGEDIFHFIASRFEEDVWAVAGNAVVFSEESTGGTKIIKQYSPAGADLMECSTIGSNYFNAWFFRRSVFSKIGAFNIKYRIAGDREFMFRFALADLRYVTINRLTYQYQWHSDSLTFDDTIEKRRNSVSEHLEMTGFYLRDAKVSEPVKALLTQLRTRETLSMAIRYSKARKFHKIPYYAFAGMQYDLLWLPKFWKLLFQRKTK